MDMNISRVAVIAILFVTLGCQTAQIEVAPDLAAVTPMEVRGANPRRWNAPVSFGPFATSEVREGGTWGFGYRLLGIDAGFAFQPYRLSIASSDRTIHAECVTRAAVLSRKGLSVDPSFGKIPALGCGFSGDGEGTLRLNTTAMNREEGQIEFGSSVWQIRSIHNYAGSSLPSGELLGYEILNGGRVIATIETMNRGRVWIDPSLSATDQSRIAGVATALLLYDPANAEHQ